MEHYINMMLRDAPEDMEGVSNMPAAAHLFKTNSEDPKLLNDQKKKIFVHLVMQGLYLSQRGRPDTVPQFHSYVAGCNALTRTITKS